MRYHIQVKKYITFFLLFVVFVPMFVLTQSGGNKAEIDSLNSKIAEKKKKVEQLEQSIADYKKKIEQTKLQSVSLSNQMAILDNQATQVQLDIQATQQKLEAIELEIQSLDLAIQDKEQVLSRQKEIVGELVRTIHYNDRKKYIEIAASYDSFSEFYNQVQYLQTVESNLGTNVRAIRLVKEDLEDKKTKQTDRKKTYEELQKEFENKKKNLQEQSFAKEQLLVQTKSSELTYQTLLKRLKQEYQSIENEISGIEREIRRKLEEQNKTKNLQEPNADSSELSWPTQSRYITARFRDSDYPYRRVFEHNAIDIRAAHGTPVKAAASGYIARARTCTTASCYAYVMIVHADGISTVYGHLSKIIVGNDQFVTRGDVIGYSGATPGTVGAGPFTTGAHLHFEVRKNGIPVDPLLYLIKDY